MMKISNNTTKQIHNTKLEYYYRFHAPIYDATRWSFLFGRDAIVEMLPPLPDYPQILEVGCGTGSNIQQMQQRLPNAQITGIDLSSAMLSVARSKVRSSDPIQLIHSKYEHSSSTPANVDLILCSYSLTMMDNNYEEILSDFCRDLNPGGYIAIVDFNTSPFQWFRKWMNINHVDFSGNLLPLLNSTFHPLKLQTKEAYWGLWSYFLFIGQHNEQPTKSL